MRSLLIVLLLLSGKTLMAQPCSCAAEPMLSEFISCDPIRFDNGASLYWNFNCDSSWLTFESRAHKRRVIFSLGEGLLGLTGRLGHIFLQEYPSGFLVQNNVISGCCSPPEFYFYDKANGTLKASLGRLVFYSKRKNLPFVISVTNSSYDTMLTPDYNSLTIWNLRTGKKHLLPLPEGKIEQALSAVDPEYPEYLFATPRVTGHQVTLEGHFKAAPQRGNYTIKIDLDKYRD